MRVFISGVIGAVASAAAWLGLEYFVEKEYSWLAVAVGLVTGFAVHAAAGKSSGAGYLRGALAAVLALAAIVAAPRAKAEIMKLSNTDAAKQVLAQPLDQTDETEREGSDDADQPKAEPLAKLAVNQDAGPAGASKPNFKKSFSDTNMLWICVSALAAYVVGKGRDCDVPSQGTGAQGNGSQDAGAEAP